MSDTQPDSTPPSWRERLHEVIFEADTPSGKRFDIFLIVIIIMSVVVVMLESIASVREVYSYELHFTEWVFTILFSIEYILRLICLRRPLRYAKSFFGIVDLLAVIPTYLSLLFPGTQYLLAIRLLRILRVFRVLKLAQFLSEASVLTTALRASRHKITVFLFTVLTLVVILGSLMYLIEGEENGFNSIPHSIYWAIVTLTTVGYGDISPQTPLGRMLASVVMILGYAILAVPTGIVSVELARAETNISTQCCRSCGSEGHRHDAVYCRVCSEKL